MSEYIKQNFQAGQVLKASQLNHIEEGIAKILPVIEAGEAKQLVTDKDGNLIWEAKNFKKEESLELLFPEFQMTGAVTELISTSLLTEVKDMDDILVEINGTEYFSFIEWVDTESALFTIRFKVNNQDCGYSFSKNNTLFILNRGNLAGTVKVKVNRVIYTKIDSNYLPTPCIEGTGKYSILLNHGGIASGICSCAANDSTAIGDYSFAACGGVANGALSFVCGQQSHNAEGTMRSIILGENNSSNESSTYLIGKDNTANAQYTYTLGNDNEMNGTNTYALGYDNTTNATSSVAIGYGTTTNGYGAKTFGHDVHASSAYQIVLGTRNIIDAEDKYLYILGNGQQDENEQFTRSNAHTIDWQGNAWFAGSVEGTSIILSSPDGSRFNITVNNDGQL